METMSNEDAYLIDEYGDVARWFLESHKAEEWDELCIGIWKNATRESIAHDVACRQRFEHPISRKIDITSCLVGDADGVFVDADQAAAYLFADDGPCEQYYCDGYTYVFWRQT